MIQTNRMQHVTLPALYRVPVVTPPGAGGTWQGVNHGDLVTGLETAVRTQTGQNDVSRRFALSRGGADLTAALLFPLPGASLIPALGVCTSNARRRGLTVYAGAVDRETDTPVVVGVLGGNNQIDRPHWQYTAGFDLTRVCDEAVTWWLKTIPTCNETVSRLKGRHMTVPVARDFLFGRMVVEGLAPYSHAGRTAVVFARQGDDSAWGLLRAFWTAATRLHETRQMPTVLRLCQLLSESTTSPEPTLQTAG